MRALLALSLIAIAAAGQNVAPKPALPAFPEAAGFGAGTPGGRGGATLFVTNLADDGPGSLRAAVRAKGPRMVLFRVNGIVTLEAPLVLEEPFLTIAGQSAPGDGITLRKYGIVVKTHDVVLRFLRVRPGDESGKEVDGIAISSPSRNVMVDHCSVSWSVDEALSPSGDIRDVALQWNLISESLNRSVHAKGPHGYGSLARATGGVTFYRNVWAHHSGRNPRLGDNYGRGEPARYDLFNNLVYNYGNYATGLVDGRIRVNYIGNRIIPGPDSKKVPPILLSENATAETQFHLEANVVDGNPEATADNRKMVGRPGVEKVPVTFADAKFPLGFPANQSVNGIEFWQAKDLERRLLAFVGATAPRRDAVDTRIVKSIRERTGRIIDSQREVGGWPASVAAEAPADTDRDGIPDSWERTHGLNPQDPQDAKEAAPSGYPWLEMWLEEMAAPGYAYWR